MEDSIRKKVAEITARARNNTNKKFINVTLKTPNNNPMSLENVIQTKEQADEFMTKLRSLHG